MVSRIFSCDRNISVLWYWQIRLVKKSGTKSGYQCVERSTKVWLRANKGRPGAFLDHEACCWAEPDLVPLLPPNRRVKVSRNQSAQHLVRMTALSWKRAVAVLVLWSAAVVQLASGCTPCQSPATCKGAEFAEAAKCATTLKMKSPNVGSLGFTGKQWVDGQHHLTFELEDAGKTNKRPERDVPEEFQSSVRGALSYGLRDDLTKHMACVLSNWADAELFGEPSSFLEADAFDGIGCSSSINNVLAACKKAGVEFETVAKVIELVVVPQQVRVVTSYDKVCGLEGPHTQNIGAGLSFSELDSLLADPTKDGSMMMWNMCPSATALQANECKVIYGRGWYSIQDGAKLVERYEQAFPLVDGKLSDTCIENSMQFNDPAQVLTYTGTRNSQGLCAFSTDADPSANFVFPCEQTDGTFETIYWHGSTYKNRHGQASCNTDLPVNELCGFTDANSEQDFVKIFAKRLVDDFKITDGTELCVAELASDTTQSCLIGDAYDLAAINTYMEEEYDKAVFDIGEELIGDAEDLGKDGLKAARDLSDAAIDKGKPLWDKYKWYIIPAGSTVLLILIFLQWKYRIICKLFGLICCCCLCRKRNEAKDTMVVRRFF